MPTTLTALVPGPEGKGIPGPLAEKLLNDTDPFHNPYKKASSNPMLALLTPLLGVPLSRFNMEGPKSPRDRTVPSTCEPEGGENA